ncbi:MAG TPA: LamG domain-containing protein [Candidatus Pacearchaeota archaeon]|nr:LamG domain-containing protein [Candidatus Pacearchaeota archaeon]
MQFKIPKFGFKSKKRGNAAGFFGAKLSFISNHLSIISNKLSQNNHLSIINDKLSKKRINYKLSIFGKKLIINYKLLIAVGVLALAATGGTLALNGFFGGGAAIPEDTMTRGLVGYWSFDEGGGTIARDASGNNNHGTLTNGPKWTQGKSGGALQFDGKDDYVDCGNNSSLNFGTGDFTAEYWIYYTGSTKTNKVFTFLGKASGMGNNPGWYSGLTTYSGDGTNLKLLSSITNGAWGTGNLEAGAYFSPNTWQHIVLIRSGTTLKHYRNGNLDGQRISEGIGANVDNNLSFTVGAFSNGGVPVKGLIDEVRIYNRALTEAEVKYHYNRGGPVAQWDMDEGSGSMINDKSGNNNDGTLVNGTTWAQGKHGTALSFDGTDDYADAGNKDDLDITGSITIEAWVKPSGLIGNGAGHHIANKMTSWRVNGYDFRIGTGSADRLQFITDSSASDVVSTTILQNDSWYHVVAVQEGVSYKKIYINGVQDGLKSNPAALISSSAANLKIGTYLSGGEYFNGLIDEVKIYDYARTEEEIRLDYNAGMAAHLGPSGKTCSEDPASCMDYGLVGNWDMDEGTGSVINDNSGNNNHGTLTNGPKWTQGKSGGALQFDGKDDYVDAGNGSSLNITDSITLEAWVFMDYTGSKNSDLGFIAKESSYLLYDTWGELRVMSAFWIDGAWRHSTSTGVNSNQWYHLVTTYSSLDRTIRFYIDGNEVAPVVLSGLSAYSLNISANNVHLGNGTLGKKNRVDEARIYNRVLTAEEVRYHYNHGGPVAYWDMDEGSGLKINDKSGNGNDGTISGAAWTQGKYGSALSFDGADDYASVANSVSLNPTSKITVGLWAKRNGAGTGVTPGLLSKRANGFGLIWQGGADADILSTRIYQSDGTAINSGNINNILSVGAWRYITLVADGTNVITYVDGVPKKSVPYNGTILTGTTSLTIGQQSSAYFNGLIDDVRIYNYARTEEEIRLDYNAGMAAHLGPSGKTCSEDPASCMDYGLVGNWDMDEGNGSVLNDNSGNNNHGTLTSTRINGPQWTQGKNGTALQFDGKDDYVRVADSDSLTFGDGATDGSFSIESWINYDLINSFNIVVKTNEYLLTNSNCLRLYLRDASSGGVIAKSPICLSNTYKGKWVHLIVTYDGNGFDGINFYINGNQLSGGSSTGSADGYVSMENTTNALSIGSTTAKGKIDEVKIYNRALSAEEVRYHYNQGKPVAQWDFDEGEGTRAFDVSGNNNTGVLTNGPTWVEGKRGSALSFDGADDSVSCGTDSSLNIAESMTASAWIYPKTLGEGIAGHIVGRGGTGGWCFYLYNGNSLKLYAGTIQAVSSANSITLNQWQYATVVYDKQNVRFFVNGVEKGVTAATDSILNTGSCVIGARTVAGDFDFNGYLDEVKVYNYARTAEQIMQDYNAGLATHLK